MSYYVGQTIYLLNTEKLKVYPVQVVEEIIRKTMNGKEITYIVKLPDKEGTEAKLSDINAKVFIDDKNLKSFMYENAKKSIDKIINDANTIKEEVFQKVEVLENKATENKDIIDQEDDVDYLEELKKPTNLSVQNGAKDDTIKVHLGNGIMLTWKLTISTIH